MCGVGLTLKNLYKVEEEEAGSLILPKPLLEGWLVYRKGGNKVKTFYNFSTKNDFFSLQKVLFLRYCVSSDGGGVDPVWWQIDSLTLLVSN